MADGTSPEEAKLEANWDLMIVRLLALRGDPELEAFLTDKHPELIKCAMPLWTATATAGSTVDEAAAAEARDTWFNRKLKSQASSIRERRQLCKMLTKSIRRFAEKYESPGPEAVSAHDALKDGGAQEGPVICAGLAAGLAGTRFEGLRIARERPGIYQLGKEPRRVAVQAELDSGDLLIHGYFEGDVLHPVRVPIRTFLEEHGAAPASDQCDMFGGGAGAGSGGTQPLAQESASGIATSAKRPRELPPGWIKRESRSKPGVFYYVNEAKGLSQLERPQE